MINLVMEEVTGHVEVQVFNPVGVAVSSNVFAPEPGGSLKRSLDLSAQPSGI